jgi:mannose-6-phosphate isomerase-like protein (cupin superfamily)
VGTAILCRLSRLAIPANGQTMKKPSRPRMTSEGPGDSAHVCTDWTTRLENSQPARTGGPDYIRSIQALDRPLEEVSTPPGESQSARGLPLWMEEERMTIKDIGPQPQSFDLEKATLENTTYRTVALSGKYLQLTLMSIPVGGDIGLEAHPQTDQFLRLDAGRGRVQMGPTKDQLDFDREVEDGWSIFVPAGTWHNITNIGDEPMQLYTVYAPDHHAPGKIHATAADAEHDEERGNDEPPNWSVQPAVGPSDEHA